MREIGILTKNTPHFAEVGKKYPSAHIKTLWSKKPAADFFTNLILQATLVFNVNRLFSFMIEVFLSANRIFYAFYNTLDFRVHLCIGFV